MSSTPQSYRMMSMCRTQPGWLKMMNLTRHKKVSTKAQYKLSWRMELNVVEVELSVVEVLKGRG